MGGPTRARITLTGCAVLGLSCVLAPSCRDPEEIVIDFSTDVPCSAFAGLSVAVASLPHRAEADFRSTLGTVIDSSECHGGKLGRLVIAKAEAEQAALIAVLAYKGGATTRACMSGVTQDCIFARRRIPFLSGTALSATVTLLAVCKGLACDVLSTCREGGLCYASDVKCSGGACDEPALLAAPGSDASVGYGDGADSGGSSADSSDGSRDGNMNPSGLKCGLGVRCLPGQKCCLRTIGDVCLDANSTFCSGITDTLVECYSASDCNATQVCAYSGMHGGTGSGFTHCSQSTAVYERVCLDTAECVAGGFPYPCQPNATSDPATDILTCRP